ncbi:MAG: hypothetical protein ACYSSP_01735 [Planctomycetota bacterium]|jgi:hypothetical protein
MNEKQIVHVFSTNYAGSHFLALQLASHSKCASVGEFKMFKEGVNKKVKSCNICESDEECPLFKGLTKHPVKELYKHVFINLEALEPDVHTIVDNSKKPRWARRFINMQGVKQKYIHLIRDPRALIRRWMLLYQTIEQKKKVRFKTARRCWCNGWNILTDSQVNVYIWKWLYHNRLITNFLNRYNPDFRIVTYYDLVTNTDGKLSELMNWIGFDYEPEQKEYWKFTHHCAVNKNYFQAPEDGEKIFDQRWKEFLDEETQMKVSTHPVILSYLDEIGLHLEDYGITSNQL